MTAGDSSIPAWLDELCDRFEAAWSTPNPISIEFLLDTVSEEQRPVVLKSLLQVEYELRCKSGDAPTHEDLNQRFPNSWEIVDSVLQNSLPIDSMADRNPVAPRGAQLNEDDVPIPRETLRIPRQLGRYRIIRKLGQGAMGSVFLAHDGQLNRQVALKIPRGDLQRNAELRLRFEREAQAAAALQHQNICPIHDIGEFIGVHFICMAYINGFPLSRYAIAESGLREQQVAELVLKLASALATAHEAGFIHRDLKPANVMIDQDDEPVILDFGLARRVDTHDDLRVTQIGTTLGSPAYMSPEQVDGDQKNVGPASDIYSLGVILYELLTGRLPFEGSTASVLGQIMTKAPSKPSDYRRDLSVHLEQICLKMMARAPDKRHASMHDVAAELQKYLDSYNREAPVPVADVDEATRMKEVGEQRRHQIERLIALGDYGQAEKLLVTLSRESDPDQHTAADWAATELLQLRRTRQEVRAGRHEIYSTAARLMKSHDYDQAMQLLEEYPYDLRTPKMQELLEEAESCSHTVSQLKNAIKAVRQRGDNDTMLPLLHQLLDLKPYDRMAKELLEQLTQKQRGPVSRVLGKQQSVLITQMPVGLQWGIVVLAILLVGIVPAYYWADNFLRHPTLVTDHVETPKANEYAPGLVHAAAASSSADRQKNNTDTVAWTEYLAAFELIRAARYDDAAARLAPLQEQGSPYGDLGIGWLHLYKREYETAVVFLNKARNLQPSGRAKWNVMTGLAKSHHRLGHTKQVETLVQELLTYDANATNDFRDRAEMLLLTGEITKAQLEAQKTIRREPAYRDYFAQRYPELLSK